MFGQAMNPIIRADGSPTFAMISTLAGAVANIILDPVFIFCFKWGMLGAAAATVIGQIVTAVFAVWYLLHMKRIKPASADFALHGGRLHSNADAGRHQFSLPDQSCGCNGGDQ